MNVSHLVRDASIADTLVKEVDGKLVALKPLDIHVPFRYVPAKLAHIGERFMCIGIFPIVYDNKRYMVSNISGYIELTASSMRTEEINGEEYYILSFDRGSIISPLMDMLVSDDGAYNVYNEFIGKAKIPWFLNYEDIGKCLANVHYFNGITLSGTNAVIELIVASIARSSKDTNVYYREVIKGLSQQNTDPPTIVPLRAVISGTTNTMGKLMGSYADEGLTSALTVDGGPSGFEDMLRL